MLKESWDKFQGHLLPNKMHSEEAVLWRAETKLEFFGKPNELYVHRCKNEAYREEKTGPSLKHRQGLFYALGLLCPIWLNASRIRHLKTINLFWSEMCCSASQQLVSSHKPWFQPQDRDPKNIYKDPHEGLRAKTWAPGHYYNHSDYITSHFNWTWNKVFQSIYAYITSN